MSVAIEPPPSPVPRPYLEFRPLLRALGIASDARNVLLAAAGLVVVSLGWLALDLPFGPTDSPGFPGSPVAPDLPAPVLEAFRPLPRSGLFDANPWLTSPFRAILAPFLALFTPGVALAEWFRAAGKAVWAAVAWGIFGGAIARVAVVRAADHRKLGLWTALRFALRKAGPLIGAPLTPMLAVAFLAAGLALFGLLFRLPSPVGGFLAAVLGFVPLLIGLTMAVVLVGLMLGWPLMHASVAAEGEDAADALSRSYSYINQRLVRYAAHAAVALAIGYLGLIAAGAFARVVLGLADWGVSLGAPSRVRLDDWGLEGLIFWGKVVGVLVLAWAYSYLWSAASILYLILRRDVDGTPWHQVYQPEHDLDTFAGEPSPARSEPEAKPAAEAEVV